MPVRQRRRADAVLLAIAVLLVGVAAAAAAAAGDNERVTGLWASAEISSDGSARITEVIDYDFGGRRQHGVFRDVPGLAPGATVSVSSATAPDQFELIRMGSTTRIRIGDPSRTISGRHRYRIQYPLDGLASGGLLAWDAVGTSWQVEVSGIEVHVTAPFEFTGMRCVQGPAGSERPCTVAQPAPGHLVGRIQTLAARERATLYASGGRELGDAPRLPASPSGAVADVGVNPLLPGLLATAFAMIAAVAVLWWMRRCGRERVAAGGPGGPLWGAGGGAMLVDSGRLESSVAPEPDPPQELTPAQGGILLAEGVHNEHKVAWLISAAIDGYLEVEREGSEVTLVRCAHVDAAAFDPSTAALIKQMLGGEKRLRLGSYDPFFAGGWRMLGQRLAAWQRTCDLWDSAGDRRRGRARLLAVILAPLGVVLTGLGGGRANWPGSAWWLIVGAGAVAAGSGLATLICAWELRVRTPEGTRLWLLVESLRRFLADCGADQVDEAAERGRLVQYTAWAVALGVSDYWSRAVAASAVAPSRHLPLYEPGITRILSAAAAAASTAPPSSGSGSGGGGAGGGAGGGGGGSW